MSQGNVGGTLPPNTTTGKSSSDGAYGPSTTKPTTARKNYPVRKITQLIQNLKSYNNVYSLDRLGIKRRGDSEDPTVNTMPVGTITYLNKDHQPDMSSELQGRKEQRPRANITQTSPESFENMGNIHILPRNGQGITPGENENSTTEEFPLVEEHQKSSDVNNAITTAAAHSHEPKESSLQLQVKIKPARPPPPPPSDRVILPDNHMNPTQMATVDPFIDTEDSPPNHSLQSSCPEEKEMSIMREIPLVEAHLESRDMNNGTTSGASHSQEPKESSQQLPEKKKPKVAKRPPPPPERVTSINKYINVPLMDVGDTSKGTEDITLKQGLQSLSLEEMENSTTRTFHLVEAHLESRDMNNGTTSEASHSQEPKDSPQQLPEKKKPKVAKKPPPPLPSDRVTLLDNNMDPTQMATVDSFIDKEDSPPNHSLQSSCPEEKEMSIMREFPLVEAHLESRDMNNGTTSEASQEPKESSPQLPEKKKPKVAKKPLPPPPPERVTSINKYINVPPMDVGDTSKGTEDITPKQSLQSLSLEEMENSTTRTFPLVEAHLESRDMNNGSTSGASQEPKESSQQLPEKKKPRTAPRSPPSLPPPPPPPPPHPPENVTPRDTFMNATQVVIDDKSTWMEDIVSKQSLLSCAEEMENSTKIKIPLVEAHQSRDANNVSATGGARLNEPQESSQKEKPKVPSRALPPLPPVRGTPKDKVMNTIPTAKGDTSRIEDGPPKHTLQPSSHGPKGSPPHLEKAKPPRPLKSPVKRTTSAEKPLTATQMVIGGPWRGTEDSHPKHTLQPSSFDASRVLVLSWDLVHEASNVSSYLMGNQNCDCPCVALSSLKKDSEWTSLVDQSSIVIFYTTPKSQKPLHKMGRYLEYCVSKKGAEKVIAVITDANNLEEDWTTKWEENKFSKIQQFQISRAELGWISRNEMPRKIEEIRKSLIIHTGSPTGRMQMSQPTNQTTKQTVGFLSWSPKDDSQWLLKLLQPPYFQDIVGDIIYIDGDKNENEKIMEQIVNVPLLILHFTQESFRTFFSQPDSSERLRVYCEKKIIVVIDDLDGKNSEMTIKELYKKSNMESISSDLFMFGKEEKEVDYLTHLTGDELDNKEAQKKQKLFQDAISRSMKLPDPPRLKLGKVGIFSRSSQTDYEWLEPLLKSANLGVEEVRPVYISNKGYERFYEEITLCDFAILYHTKNRGRVNITNVNDSLYDVEIEDLSTALGRNKVLVVIDDLQDSSWRTKNRILKFQYSIPKYARNMLLVSEEEKKKGGNEGKLLTRLIEIIVSPAVDEEGPWETDGHNPETNKPETLTIKNDPEDLSNRNDPKTSDTEIGEFTD
ncbi:uncharacterized protein LOC143923398 [Lithobates pipiens]